MDTFVLFQLCQEQGFATEVKYECVERCHYKQGQFESIILWDRQDTTPTAEIK